MNTEGSICEYCHIQHDGSYGSGRFCSAKCARGFSTSKKRKQINAKVSKSLSGKPYNMTEARWIAVHKGGQAKHEQWLNKKAKVGKDELDITNDELEKYKETHPVCEICGRPEKFITSSKVKVSSLARDHNHNTGHFRGLLCGDCNRKLGWFEANRKKVCQYLREKDGSVE